jgi:uncharacterized membrane protein YbhN (UPF0104 family)
MKKKQILALIITVGLLGLVFHKLNWTELVATLKGFNPRHLPLIVVLYVLVLYIRGIRWKALLLNNPKYSALHLGEVFIVGSMLNAFLPMRAGDAYRAYYLGNIKQESKMKVFGSIILERILDGVYVFFILLAAVLLYCRQKWILDLALVVGVLFIGSLITAFIIYKIRNNLPPWLPNLLASLLNGFEVLECKSCFVIANITSFFIWGVECLMAYLIVNSFGLGLGFAAGLFVISLISFSTAIPSTSVFLGPYQYAYILALGIFGIDKGAALAVSTVHQAILMLIVTVIGSCCLLKFNISLKEIK